MTTILPHIDVSTARLCDGDDEVNCFLDLKGCNTTNSEIKCGDVGEWSVSLAFIGTGVLVSTGTTCSEDTCKWTIDGEEGCTDWFSEATGGLGATSYIRATGLDGPDDTKHTLVVSSTGSSNSTSTDGPTLTVKNGTRIYTGPDTPVHPGDYIALSPNYSEVKVEGEWSELGDKEDAGQRNFEGGEGSISVGVVGDAFRMGYAFAFDEDIEDDDKPVMVTTINGEETEPAGGQLIPLDPGGYYNVGYKASFDTNTPVQYVTVYNIVYHPLDNITSIRDIIPEALVGSFNDAPPQSNELGCAVSGPGSGSESGAVSHLRENTGAFFLLPVILMWSLFRLKF